MKKLVILCIMLLIPINIKAMETSATSAILVDTDSGRILYSKDIHNKISIANYDYIVINNEYARNINNICTEEYNVIYSINVKIITI